MAQARPKPESARPAVVLTVLAVLALLVWRLSDMLLVAFAAILLAVFLRGLATVIARYTPLSAGVSLALAVVAIAGLLALAFWLSAPSLAKQTQELASTIPDSLENLRAKLQEYSWGRWVLTRTSEGQRMTQPSAWLSRANRLFAPVADAVTYLVIVLVLALYLAAQPALYVRGVLRLFPPRYRKRAAQAMAAMGLTLWWWFLGRLVAMAVIAIVTTIGLSLLDIPLALLLGVLAGLLNFVPNIGPILALAPAALLALTKDPASVLWVMALYVGVQALEGYLLTPLVERQTVSTPPALVIFSQLVMAVVAGALGLFLATPLTAVVMVLVAMLCLEDQLGEQDTGLASVEKAESPGGARLAS